MKKVLFVILIFFSTSVGAQYKRPYFNTLNVASGLPEAFVQSSLQDKYGYIWLGTQNGLVRYDGYKLKPYTMHNAKGAEIINASIRNIFEDSQGQIWIQMLGEGFSYYDRKTDAFVKYSFKENAMDSLSKMQGQVFYWKEDNQSHVYWIGVQLFLNIVPFKILCFNANKNTLEEYSAAAKGKYFIPTHKTVDIKRDANGKMWLIGDSLLSYFDINSRSFKPWFVLPDNAAGDFFEAFQPDPADADILWMNTYDPAFARNPKIAQHVMRIFQFNTKTKQYKTFLPDVASAGTLPASGRQIYTDSLQRVWVSTEKGLSLFNRKDATFTNYPIRFFNASVTCILAADKQGNLWFGGNFEGLHYLDIKSGEVSSYKGNGDEGELQRNTTLNQLWFDKSGTLWVSSPFEGISYLNRQKSLFAPIPILQGVVPIRESTKPFSYNICGKQGDSICFINDTANLYAWHTRTNRYDRIDLKNQYAYRQIVNVVSGNDGTLWIASRGQGLYNYDPKTKSSINYTQMSNDSLSLNNILNCLATGKDGVLWIGTSVQGIFSFNKKTEKFTRYPFIINDGTLKANNALDDRTVICTYFDSSGILWIGTNLGGLNRFDTKSGKFTSYLNREKGFNCVVSIMEDSQKRLWAGTYLSGLFLFDRKTGSFKRYSEKDGLLGNNTTNITEDAAGNIWSFNDRGMSRLNPGNQTITSFTEFKVDGRRFYNFKDGEGKFYFTTKDGMVSFNPLQLNENRIPPEVVIESVNYHPANARTPGDTILFTEGRQDLTLAYNENKIGFQYVALHFADAANNKYAYQLEGYDKEWVQAGTNRTSTYTNLSPGTYNFKVKASNGDGLWNESGSSFTIIILPPWWKTWWAYIMYALMVLGALRIYSKYRERRLRKEKESLQLKVEERTSELKKSIENLKATQTQLIQAEKMASLGELTAGIAHEIQNPLNFVNNFAEVNRELVDELQHELKAGKMDEAITISNDIRDNEGKISYHGKRADAIVKAMLQHSRSSSGQKIPTDLNALCDEYLRLAYHGLRAKDNTFNVTMNTDFDKGIGNINIVPQDMGRVLLNLINNAFYAVHEKSKSIGPLQGEVAYEPAVTVSTKRINDMVEIKVGDNGNGIPENIKEKIFQPFFTTKPTGEGTGLGLSLSYDIIKAHGGGLKVDSRRDSDAGPSGTEFIITLPIT